METEVKLISLFKGIWICLSDVAAEGFDHWDVWVLGRRMEVFSASAVEVDPLCLD